MLSATPSLLLSLQNINVTLSGKTIISEVDLDISKGEIVTLIGPNGAGKTTLVRVVIGLLQNFQGKRAIKPKLKIGYMPQNIALNSQLPLTVKRFLQIGGGDEKMICSRMAQMNIATIQQQQMESISGGELQRVLLARALMRNPELLVLDEPAQRVDIRGQTEVYQIISQIRDEENCGVLIVSHDLHLVMAAADKVLCLNQHICCQGRPEKITSDPAYIELFGESGAENIALYTHHHDHDHDLHGDVVDSCGSDIKSEENKND